MSDPNKKIVQLIRSTTADEELVMQKENALSNKVNWKGFRGAYLDGDETMAITNYDKADKETRARMLEANPAFASIFSKLITNVKQPDTLKYILVLVEEMFEDFSVDSRRVRIDAFLRLGKTDASLPVAPFLTLLDMQDQYVQHLAGHLAGALLAAESDAVDRSKEVDHLLRWVLASLKKSEGSKDRHSVRAAIKSLQNGLQKDSVRARFSSLGGLQVLSTVLNDQFKAVMAAKQQQQLQQQDLAENHSNDRDLQLIYETLFCCWLLSYNADVAEKDFTGTLIVANTVKLLREVDKEKIRRVGLAMLKNLSGKALHDEAMIHAGFWKVVQQFAVKRWSDEDIVSDVQFLQEKMEAKMVDMTTWDRYKQELLSGQLEWSPAHKSEKFWRENFARFSEKNFELVGILAALLKVEDPQVVAIAAHDLGEFSRFHPQGKRLIHEHGIKKTIMLLIDSKDLVIQQHALLALQKLMVANWEYLSSGSNKS